MADKQTKKPAHETPRLHQDLNPDPIKADAALPYRRVDLARMDAKFAERMNAAPELKSARQREP